MQKGKKGSGKVGDGSEADIVKNFQLVVDETKVNSATVPVGFCVSKKITQDQKMVARIQNELLHVFIKVKSEKGTERRYAVPLKDMYYYLPMVGKGVNKISYYIVGLSQNYESHNFGVKDAKTQIEKMIRGFLEEAYMGYNYAYRYAEGDMEINMSEEYFDKDTWLKVKAREYLGSMPLNGCKARLQILKSAPALLLHALLAVLVLGFYIIYGSFLLIPWVLFPLFGYRVDMKEFVSDAKRANVYGPLEYFEKWFKFKYSPFAIGLYGVLLYVITQIIIDLKMNIGKIFLGVSITLAIFMTIKYLWDYVEYRIDLKENSEEYKLNLKKIEIIAQREKKKEIKALKKQKGKERVELKKALSCMGQGDGMVSIPEPEKSFLEEKGICKPVSY